MAPPRSPWKYSRKGILTLLYVAIAVTLVGQAVASSWTLVQWFDSFGKLELLVKDMVLELNDPPQVVILAEIRNPTSFNGIALLQVAYNVFINSTSEVFHPPPPPTSRPFYIPPHWVASRSVPYEANPLRIPPLKSLDLSFSLPISPGIVDPLRVFVRNHPLDLEKFVEITLTMPSSFGVVLLPYCYKFPQRIFTICPQ